MIGIGFQVVAHPPRLNASRTAINVTNAERYTILPGNMFFGSRKYEWTVPSTSSVLMAVVNAYNILKITTTLKDLHGKLKLLRPLAQPNSTIEIGRLLAVSQLNPRRRIQEMRLNRIAIIPTALAACGIVTGCFTYHKPVEEAPAPVVQTVPEPVVAVPAASSSSTTTTTDNDGVVERQKTTTYTTPAY